MVCPSQCSLPLGACLLLAIFLPPAHAQEANRTPEIAAVRGSAQSVPSPVVVYGNGLGCENARLVAWAPTESFEAFEQEKAFETLATSPFDRAQFLPAEPPEGARSLSIHAKDSNGHVLTATPGRNMSGILWVVNEAGTSSPFVPGLPDLFFVFPESATPGSEIRIFGRNATRIYRPVTVALKHRETGECFPLTIEPARQVRSPSYEISRVIPEDLPPGSYEVFVNNTMGGYGAWSDPLAIEIIAPSDKAPTAIDAGDFGVAGDGRTDDTDAIRNALAKAAETPPAVVRLPSGVFRISGTLELPEGVSLEGMGMNSTTLLATSRHPMQNDFPSPEEHESYALDWIDWWKNSGANAAPMVWLRDQSRLAHLHLQTEAGSGVLMGILIARAPGVARDIRVEQVGFTLSQPTHGHESAVSIMGYTERLVLFENQFHGGNIEVLANQHVQPYIGFNELSASRHGVQPVNLLFPRAFERGIIEENILRGAERNFSMQMGRRWGNRETPVDGERQLVGRSHHMALIGNRFLDGTPRRHNGGETMIEGGGLDWHRKVQTADQNTVSISGEPLENQTGNWLLILRGPGFGQYRRVVDHQEGNVLVLDKPWDALPDSTTLIAGGNLVVEHLWLDNTDENTAGWTGFWGGNVGHIVDGHIIRNGAGLYLWSWDQRSVTAFVTIAHCWISNRGNIRLLGPGLVFGNSVLRGTEVIDFAYRPSQHGTIEWAHPVEREALHALSELTQRAGIQITGGEPPEIYSEDVPFRDWNFIDRTLILNGPVGIHLAKGVRNTLLHRVVLAGVSEPLIDQGTNTILVGPLLDDQAATETLNANNP